ncbi:hypothetical protein MSG28_009596 [Choristoneura fumiferana]|uniref:Uncharacterized protein n=1 Tax=Choristoneura fumiferana TaxID=7141 RepID=A0ACC0JC35_CHOFU|nr:hypothetical protein MSG28_009596 [Choristoneura fumiferana]
MLLSSSKIKKTHSPEKLMNAYCDRAGLSMQVVRFRFDGQPINENDTPTSLEMEEGDTIERILRSMPTTSSTPGPNRSGLLSFEEFVTGLSVLSRGSLEEKLRWTFSLYDINGDGCITKEEMTDIVTAIYDLMGRVSDPLVEDEIVQQKKMDLNRDGVVTLDEFLDCCVRDEDISRSMGVFDSSF